MPLGINMAPEVFLHRLNQVLKGRSGIRIVADDVLIAEDGDSEKRGIQDHDAKLCELKRFRA